MHCTTDAGVAGETAGAAVGRNPDSETDTPPPPPPPRKSSYTNGSLKRYYPGAPMAVVVAYRECLKNHAASIGGYAVDGCCEFMPSATATTTDPTTLKCAACGCHRNFHRRDPDDPIPLHHHPPPPRHLMTQFQPSDEHHQYPMAEIAGSKGRNGKKRFRTRFSKEQKEKMYEFSEKLGWKIGSIDDNLIKSFCSELGIERGVFKVWMHNNKNTLSKRENLNSINLEN